MRKTPPNTKRNPVLRGWQCLTQRFRQPVPIARAHYTFLPAALEIQETPPSPIGRSIVWTIILLFIVAIAWACIGKMDVVATAQGKIIPGGRTKTVQPVELGKVRFLHVAEGQRVAKGDPLITLEGASTRADVDRIDKQLANARADVLRFRQLHALVEEEAGVPEGRMMIGQEVAGRRAEQQRIRATKIKLERTLPLVTERVQSLERLLQKHMVARDSYLQLEQERIELQQDLAALEAQDAELIASIEAGRLQLAMLKAEALKINLLELNNAEKQIAVLEQELIKARQRHSQQIITAPIDGTVQQLAIHTVGGVVTPAQELMQIVPSEGRLEVEAFILNRDIGFVEEGQAAAVKIDTFNFTRYGTIDAKVASLSHDAVSNEELGLVYLAKVLMKKTRMQINQRLVNLSPGMAVTVEVKTGKRRIIEYFLSPLLKYQQESIRER